MAKLTGYVIPEAGKVFIRKAATMFSDITFCEYSDLEEAQNAYWERVSFIAKNNYGGNALSAIADYHRSVQIVSSKRRDAKILSKG